MAVNPFRNLPSVNEVLQVDRLRLLEGRFGNPAITEAVRKELDAVRADIRQGKDGDASIDAVASRVCVRLETDHQPKLRRVINATGIVLHTNLGRAPMAEEAARAAYDAARGYLNLEMDLESGKRSSRQNAVREWVAKLTGAESATVVNNNAAATVLVLRALCRGKEVVVSRGQLIEIGGSFRIPEIMGVSGATLREVGTTNITRLSDYEKAIGPDTAALMQIHPSNYRVGGFTKSVPVSDLVELAKKKNLIVIDDIGSGALLDFARFGFEGEPVARESIAAGADVVLFSGDKLLGGPQAGIIAGKSELIRAIEKDPLMRAFRTDKMTLAALEATLRMYLREDVALSQVPTLHLLGLPLGELEQRAKSLAKRLAEIPGVAACDARLDSAFVGGGSLPDQQMKTWVAALRLASESDNEVAARLRRAEPAVVCRVQKNELLFDVRTIFSHQTEELIAAVGRAVGGA